MEVKRDQLALKLQQLNTTQQSIENTSKFCLFYYQDAKGVVAVWDEEFGRAGTSDKKLALLYLANHVLQEGRKRGKEFTDEFAKVMPKCIKEMMRQTDDKARRSVDRLVKVWEERRVFGPREIKSLKDTMSKVAAASSGSTGGIVLSKTNGAASEDQRRLQVLGPLGDAFIDIQQAEQRSSFVLNRSKQLKPNVHLEGSYAEVASAKDVLSNAVSALQSEVNARKKAIAELKAAQAKQEECLKKSEQQLREFEQQRGNVEDRLKALLAQQQQQQQQAQAAANAAAAAAPRPSPPAPPQQHHVTFVETVTAYEPGPPQAPMPPHVPVMPMGSTYMPMGATPPQTSTSYAINQWGGSAFVPHASQPGFGGGPHMGSLPMPSGSGPLDAMQQQQQQQQQRQPPPPQQQQAPLPQPLQQQQQQPPQPQANMPEPEPSTDLSAAEIAARLASTDQSALLSLANALASSFNPDAFYNGLDISDILGLGDQNNAPPPQPVAPFPQEDDAPYDPDNPY